MPYEEPEYLPWEGQRVPVTFLAGYLGAGKTTLLNELLATADRPIAVMVNDVGAINIDARLIKRQDGAAIELTDGCVCCSLSGGFADAFDALRERDLPPEHLVVELSGVADPSRVLPWAHTAGFTLDGVVTLVDALLLEGQLEHPTSAMTIGRQVEAADLLLVTKTDIAGRDAIQGTEAKLRALAPNTPIIGRGRATGAALLQFGGGTNANRPTVPAATLFDQHSTHVIALPQPITGADLAAILDGLGEQTVRAKGIAIHPDGTRVLIQVVGKRRTITELGPAEPADPTDLVVISI